MPLFGEKKEIEKKIRATLTKYTYLVWIDEAEAVVQRLQHNKLFCPLLRALRETILAKRSVTASRHHTTGEPWMAWRKALPLRRHNTHHLPG